MKIQKISERIIFVRFKNIDQMAKTVLRIGEHCENRKEFSDKRLTFRQFLKWYKENIAKKPYKKYFQGLTLPDHYVRHFILDYKPIEFVEKEKEFISGLSLLLGKKNLKRKIKFAVILCPKGLTSSVFKHELSHALFYLDNKYAHKALNIVRKIDKNERKKIKDFLIKVIKYDRRDASEEIACRLIERVSLKSLFEGIKVKVPNKIRNELKTLLNQHPLIAKNN